jgi:hypothetical protein
MVPSRNNTGRLGGPTSCFRNASLTPEGLRKTGSGENICDLRRLSPPGRPWRIQGNEEKWFRKTNVPASLFVAELKDPSEGPEIVSLFPEVEKLRSPPNDSAVV